MRPLIHDGREDVTRFSRDRRYTVAVDRLLPVLVAQLADDEAREILEAVSFANGVAVVPLVDAPIDGSRHVLEAWTPGAEAPTLFLAEPAGAPTPGGFPLRLSAYDDASGPWSTDDAPPASVRNPPPATARHATGRTSSRDAEGAAPDTAPESLAGPRESDRHPALADAQPEGIEPTVRAPAKRSPSEPPTIRGRVPSMSASAVSVQHAAALVPSTKSQRPPTSDWTNRSLAGGKYVIQELLGEGGIGKVYKARHRDLRKGVAIKVLHASFQADADFCQSFAGEAMAAKDLVHPNVVRLLDFGQEPDGLLYIVMDLIQGRTLGALLQSETIAGERIAEIMMQVCAGLQTAHDRGIVHRDIKPENVMLVPGFDDDGKAVEVAMICDFGIAQHHAADVGPDEPSLIPRGPDYRVAGTPEYMSPEQCRGEPLDGRSDVYACGITLYELATGHVPFTHDNPLIVLKKHLEEAPLPPSHFNPDVDPLLESIVMKSLRKDPAARHQSARELRNALKELLEPILVPRAPSVIPVALKRREVLDNAALPRIEEPAAGFQEMFVAFAGAISRTGYYERGHPEADVALERLAERMDATLKHRGELSLARRDVGQRIEFSVLTGIGEVHDLRKLIPGIADMYEPRLGEVFQRRNVVSLTLVDGITPDELGHVIELLSGPEISKKELRAQLDRLQLSHTKALLAEDLLGQGRKLAWQVDLCISRLARDLRSLPLLRDVDDEKLRLLRVQLISDVVRALSRPEHVQSLLVNTDLVEREVAGLREYAALDLLAAFVEAIPRGRLLAAAALMLSFVGDARTKKALATMAAKFARDRSGETDDLLRELYKRGVLAGEQLPPDILAWVHAEQRLEQLLADPLGVLGAIAAIEDVPRFAAEVGTLERVVQALARRNETTALAAVVRMLEGIARGSSPGTQDRAAIAARALRATEAPGNLTSVAERYLVGPVADRETAKGLLLRGREAGALALYAARCKVTDQGARPRFVAATREIGKRAWPAVWGALQRLPPLTDPTFDAELAEDLLRAVPEVTDEAAGAFVARMARQGPPGVARAAVGALVSLWGPRARPLLVGILDQGDDGVRIAALAALRRMRGLDEHVLSRIDRILGRAVPAGDELRATAAGVLTDVPTPLRPAAMALLKRTIARKGGVAALLTAAKGQQESPEVVVAAARALLAIGGAEGRSAVEARAQHGDEALRNQLYAILDA
jgi:serine/threonine-protein kinase